MISEVSCDSGDYWEFRFAITRINYILKYIKHKRLFLIVMTYFQYYSFYCIFIQINAACVNTKDFEKLLLLLSECVLQENTVSVLLQDVMFHLLCYLSLIMFGKLASTYVWFSVSKFLYTIIHIYF